MAEDIDKSFPWGFFNGVAWGNPTICGGGGVFYLSYEHFFQIQLGLWDGTNNYAELMALRILLLFPLEWGHTKLQFFGDSLQVINSANGIEIFHVMRLISLVEDIFWLKVQFELITFHHVYREWNRVANRLSKEATKLQKDHIHIKEHTLEGKGGFYQHPFHNPW